MTDSTKPISTKDGAAVRIPPPLVYLAGVIVGVVLHAFVLSLPVAGLALRLRIAIAVFAAVLGLVVMGGAIGLFRRTGQDPKPWESTPNIISTGIYRFTRNPMYVGMALLQTAIGAALGNWWILILVPIVLWLVNTTAIRHEEVYLERKFGDEYTRYKAKVRRWL